MALHNEIEFENDTAARVFWVPEIARWSYLRDSARARDLEIIDSAPAPGISPSQAGRAVPAISGD